MPFDGSKTAPSGSITYRNGLTEDGSKKCPLMLTKEGRYQCDEEFVTDELEVVEVRLTESSAKRRRESVAVEDLAKPPIDLEYRIMVVDRRDNFRKASEFVRNVLRLVDGCDQVIDGTGIPMFRRLSCVDSRQIFAKKLAE